MNSNTVILSGGETLGVDNQESFRFSLDVFGNDVEWKAADEHFNYIGDVVGNRIWEFVGTISQFQFELDKFGLYITGGYRANPNWNDGNWVFVSVRKNVD